MHDEGHRRVLSPRTRATGTLAAYGPLRRKFAKPRPPYRRLLPAPFGFRPVGELSVLLAVNDIAHPAARLAYPPLVGRQRGEL